MFHFLFLRRVVSVSSFWLRCARAFSFPMTFLGWLVIFIYSLQHGGKLFPGILALVGAFAMHMATNLLDDLFDYFILRNNMELQKAALNDKCIYLIDGRTSLSKVCMCILFFLGVAAGIGLLLIYLSGPWVILFMAGGLFIALGYQWCSLRGLGEVAVLTAYGPLLFGGVYYVMTSSFSLSVFALSFGCSSLVASVLYNHMLMDYDADKCASKITLCRKLGSKSRALAFSLFFYLAGFAASIFLACSTGSLFYLLALLIIPLVFDIYLLLHIYNHDKTHLPAIRPWHYPLHHWDELRKSIDAPFYMRFFYSRNIAVYYMLLICIASCLQ